MDENDYRYEDADAGEYEGSAGEPRPRTQAQHANLDDTGYAPAQAVWMFPDPRGR